MAAGELDMEKTDFSMTNATTFDHHTAKITAFFIQASAAACCCCCCCLSRTSIVEQIVSSFLKIYHKVLHPRASGKVRPKQQHGSEVLLYFEEGRVGKLCVCRVVYACVHKSQEAGSPDSLLGGCVQPDFTFAVPDRRSAIIKVLGALGGCRYCCCSG